MVLNLFRDARPEILTAVLLKNHVFWDVMLCHWASGYRRFENHSTFILRDMQSQKTSCLTLEIPR
jgi:hypothetical protein